MNRRTFNKLLLGAIVTPLHSMSRSSEAASDPDVMHGSLYVYDQALKPDQISVMADTGGIYTKGLIAVWLFDDEGKGHMVYPAAGPGKPLDDSIKGVRFFYDKGRKPKVPLGFDG